MSSNGTDLAVSWRTSWGSRQIPYSVAFSRERKHLTISVHPDLRVTVVAPAGGSIEEVAHRVSRRAKWIAKQLRELERWHPLPTPKRYIPGESHLYLGRQYRLRVELGPASVALAPGRIIVRAQGVFDLNEIRCTLVEWYRKRARQVIERRMEKLRETAPRLAGAASGFRIVRMTHRWGSCSGAGTLTFHPDLIKAPVSCIDYVLVHELCHRRVPNHSAKFYRLLRAQMPDWERRRERLNQVRG